MHGLLLRWDDEFKMQTNFCYEEPESHYCLPQGDLNELDHYFVSPFHFDMKRNTQFAYSLDFNPDFAVLLECRLAF